jgi:hypothetical protein
MTSERFDLAIVRRIGHEQSRDTQTESISGDGAFIVQEVDVLLADPRLISFSMRRDEDNIHLGLPNAQVSG